MNAPLRLESPKPAIPASEWRDPATGCIRTDIQSKWKATVAYDEDSVDLTFYLDADATETDARNRARTIWTHAQNPYGRLTVTRVREALASPFDGLLPDMDARHPLDPVNDCVFDEVGR